MILESNSESKLRKLTKLKFQMSFHESIGYPMQSGSPSSKFHQFLKFPINFFSNSSEFQTLEASLIFHLKYTLNLKKFLWRKLFIFWR
jgi:hypothetical protein